MKATLVTCLLLTTAGVFYLNRTGQQPPPKDTVECELLKTKHLAVNVTINDQGPFRLIFDTGSPVVLLSSRVAKEAKLTGAAKRKGQQLAGNWPGQILVPSIQIGNAVAENVPAIVFDHPTLKAIEGVTGRIDGIVGFPFFARFKTTVDYATLRIKLEDSTYQPDDVMQAMMKTLFDSKRDKRTSTIGSAGFWGIEFAKDGDDLKPGINVTKVYPGSPASEAGLQVNDRLLTIDGMWTDSEDDCIRAAAAIPPGQSTPITFMRNSEKRSITVKPGPGF